MNRASQAKVSLVCFGIICSGAAYAYERESLRHVNLNERYRHINLESFDGKLPDADVQWASLEHDWLGATWRRADGSFEIRLDPARIDSETETREVLAHEICHSATWGEEADHGAPGGRAALRGYKRNRA